MSTVHVAAVAHFEWIDDAEVGTWWADSPDAPGFYGAAASLGELQREVPEALAWALDVDPAELEVEWTTEDDVPRWAATHVSLHPEGLAHLVGTGAHAPHPWQTVSWFGGAVTVRITTTERQHGNFDLFV